MKELARPQHSIRMQGQNNPNFSGGKDILYCEYCGKKFERWPSIRTKRDFCSRKCASFGKRVSIDEDKAYKLYFIEHKSMDKVGEELGCPREHIKTVFKRNNWKPRTRSEAFVYNEKEICIPKNILLKLYIDEEKSLRFCAKKHNCSTPVICRLLKKYDTKIRTCSEGQKALKNFGNKNHNWKGGLSKLPYPFHWTIKLKAKIRKRDNYHCVACGMTEKEHNFLYKRNLTVHHIDYNKQNCKKNNLATTCVKCNAKANANRDYWFAFYTYVIENQ